MRLIKALMSVGLVSAFLITPQLLANEGLVGGDLRLVRPFDPPHPHPMPPHPQPPQPPIHPLPSPVTTQVVYRKLSIVAGFFDHLWTVQPTEGEGSYQFEGPVFKTYVYAGPKRTALYRCFNYGFGHFLTTDPNCEAMHSPAEGPIGYISTVPRPGHLELVRCYQSLPNNRIHFLSTVSREECASANHIFGGIHGYVPTH